MKKHFILLAVITLFICNCGDRDKGNGGRSRDGGGKESSGDGDGKPGGRKSSDALFKSIYDEIINFSSNPGDAEVKDEDFENEKFVEYIKNNAKDKYKLEKFVTFYINRGLRDKVPFLFNEIYIEYALENLKIGTIKYHFADDALTKEQKAHFNQEFNAIINPKMLAYLDNPEDENLEKFASMLEELHKHRSLDKILSEETKNNIEKKALYLNLVNNFDDIGFTISSILEENLAKEEIVAIEKLLLKKIGNDPINALKLGLDIPNFSKFAKEFTEKLNNWIFEANELKDKAKEIIDKKKAPLTEEDAELLARTFDILALDEKLTAADKELFRKNDWKSVFEDVGYDFIEMWNIFPDKRAARMIAIEIEKATKLYDLNDAKAFLLHLIKQERNKGATLESVYDHNSYISKLRAIDKDDPYIIISKAVSKNSNLDIASLIEESKK